MVTAILNATPPFAAEAFVGRQPIYDRDLNLFGHELLFRSGWTNSVVFESGSEATSQLVLDAFLEIGLDRLSEGIPVFVNIPQSLLSDRLIDVFPPARCVLQVLEDVALDADGVVRLGALRSAGY